MRFDYSPSDIARFWAKVTKSDACWVWIASRDKDGYGRLQMGKREYIRAHVMSYEIHAGSVGDLWVLHHCDNPPCIRPDHLFLGTATQNVADRNAKGRQAQGVFVNTAKLTPVQVAEIRAVYRAGGVTLRSLASQYGVSKSMISYIVRREHWVSVA